MTKETIVCPCCGEHIVVEDKSQQLSIELDDRVNPEQIRLFHPEFLEEAFDEAEEGNLQ